MLIIKEEDDKYKIGTAIMATCVSMFFLFILQNYIKDGIQYIKQPELVSTRGVLTALSKGDPRGHHKGTRFRLLGAYTFVVNGEQRSGSQIGQFAKASEWEQPQAEQLVQAFAQAKEVTVRYDPKKPAYNYADLGNEAHSTQYVVGTVWFMGLACLIIVLLWARVVFLFTRRDVSSGLSFEQRRNQASSKPGDQYNMPGLILLTMLCGGLLYGGGDTIKSTIEYIKRPQYVETQGTIITIFKGQGRGRGGKYHPLVGAYEFSVNATPYTGTEIGQYARESVWRVNSADRIIEYFNQNKQIKVRYDPNNPSRNYADVGSNPVSFWGIAGYSAVILMFCMVCLAGWVRVVVMFVSRLMRTLAK